jgi:glycosyltransferase involved in cell wall biosynthesis
MIIVVNDGSVDATSAAAKSTNKAVVIDLPLNLGTAGAVQTGFKYAGAP